MIKNWSELNAMLPKLTEQEAEALLHEEMDGRKRRTFALRLHQRYCTLRAARERALLIGVIGESAGNRRLPPVPTTPSPYPGDPAAL
jgi:hypothetical protein